MNVTVTTRHLRLGVKARDYARDRVLKVLRLFDRLGSAQVVLDHERDVFVVEATLSLPRGARVCAKAQDRDLRAAIDSVGHKLETQVREFKGKVVKHRPSRPVRVPDGVGGPS